METSFNVVKHIKRGYSQRSHRHEKYIRRSVETPFHFTNKILNVGTIELLSD
jgi:hypothetical protein